MIRKPAFAGSFYPEDKDGLIKEIENSFLSKLGPGTLSFKKNNQELKAVIVPHAGYVYSGACAAHAYKTIVESKFPNTFIILGPAHRIPTSSISDDDWQTPLGAIKTNKDLAKKISQTTGIPINKAQNTEHSIEVQLPFLQYIFQKEKKSPEIICIMLHEDIDVEETAKKLFEATKDEDITLIVSSDFTHFGNNFDYIPFTTNIKKNLEKLNMGAIEKIKDLNPKGFLNYYKETGATICGVIPIYFLLLLLKMMDEKIDVKLLKYYTSAEMTGNESDSVSYASISFK